MSKKDKSSELIKKVWQLNTKKKKLCSNPQKQAFVELKRSPHTGKRIYQTPRKKNVTKKKTENTEKSAVIARAQEFDTTELETYITEDTMDIDSSKDEDSYNKNWLDWLKKVSLPTKKKSKNWFQRSQIVQNEWDSWRLNGWKVMEAKEIIEETCNHCLTRPSNIYCFDCNSSFCLVCDDVVHSKEIFHDRMHDGAFLNTREILNEDKDISPIARFIKLKCSCSQCGSKDLIKIPLNEEFCFIITLKGRFDVNKHVLDCKECSTITNPFTLPVVLNSGYWPGSPKTLNYLFAEEVFHFWDKFRKFLPGSSERAFLRTLNALSSENCRISVINPQNFQMAFKEWCLWLDRKYSIQEKDWLECPACQPAHSFHVDGNCKLYRYKRGKRKRASFYKGRFIVENDLVDSYVKLIYNCATDKTNDAKCGGTWTAAQNSSRKMAKLDETGLDVATCRHVVAHKALNMFRGEIFGYPMYLIKHYMVQKQAKFCFADVICKLWPFVCKQEPTIKGSILPALSVMHAKGHSLDCQVLWSGEWLDGTARSTGEETEQLFSYLSRHGNTTKHQTPEHREETITEMVFHWNKLKIEKLIPDLARRYRKNEESLSKLDESKFSESILKKWKDDIQNEARGIYNRRVRDVTDIEKALLLIEQLQSTDFVKTVNSWYFPSTLNKSKVYRLLDFDRNAQKQMLDSLLVNIDIDLLTSAYNSLKEDIWIPMLKRDIETIKIEKTVVSAHVKTVADTSKRRGVMRGKLVGIKKRQENSIKDYLTLIKKDNDRDLMMAVKDGVLPWQSDSSLESEDMIRRRNVERFLKTQHFKEEKILLKREMQTMLDFFRSKITKLTEQCEQAQEEETFPDYSPKDETPGQYLIRRSQQGIINLKTQGIRYYQRQLECALRTFLPIISPESKHDFQNVLDFSVDEVEERDKEDDENEENEENIDENGEESSGDEDEI